MPPRIDALDHLVLTVADIDRTVAFYSGTLGMKVVTFVPAIGSSRTALLFGKQKINLHVSDREFDPKSLNPTPGSADLCFLSATPVKDWVAHLGMARIVIEKGPIRRTGATGPILSIYVRDPDGNLIEISNKA